MIAEYELSRESDERFYWTSGKDSVCPPHFHRKLELLYILEGEKEVICDNYKYLLKKDQLFIADSYLMHSYLESSGKQLVIVIPNHMLKDYYLLYSNKKLKQCVIDDIDFCKSIKPYLEQLTKRENKPLINYGMINIVLGKIVEKVGVEDRKNQFDQKFIEEVLAYINENYAEEITLDHLAEHFGYSKYYFSRMFNMFLNTNLTNYLAIVRLQATIQKLKAEKITISEAAFSSGFSSIQTFYRTLKKNYSYKKMKDILNSDEK